MFKKIQKDYKNKFIINNQMKFKNKKLKKLFNNKLKILIK